MTNVATAQTPSSVTVISTSDPAIFISKEFGGDYDAGEWKWIAKRSWTERGATRTEIVEVPHDADGADEENVDTMIRFLTQVPKGIATKYAVSRTGEMPNYIAVRIA